jgi:hypothetical protein
MKIIKSLVVIASFALLISCGNKSGGSAEASVDGIVGKQFDNQFHSQGLYFINDKQCLSIWTPKDANSRSSLATYELKGNTIVMNTTSGSKINFTIYNNEILIESEVDADGIKKESGTNYFLVKE